LPGLILGMREPASGAALARVIGGGRVAGLLWFRSALGETAVEASARIAHARSLWPSGSHPLFVIDEEGGLIQQLSGLRDGSAGPWPRLPSARALGRNVDLAVAYSHGREVGRRMRRIGLDLTFAPVLDLDPGPVSPVLGTRCFAADPARVTETALSWLRGLSSAGIRGCVKHYPGHGATDVDSHHDLPRIPPGTDFGPHVEPYREIAARWSESDGPAPACLTAHILRAGCPLPASLDPGVIRAIPHPLRPVFTDSLDMEALAPFGDLKARGRLAARAGADYLVVGVDEDGGLAIARDLDGRSALRGHVDPSVPLVPAGSHPAGRVLGLPDPWPLSAIVEAAAAGLRLIEGGAIPGGMWDWILPERFRAYGSVAEPPRETGGARSIARVLRYDADSAESLAEVLAASSERPALFGWIHRGLPDGGGRSPGPAIEPLLKGSDRVVAVAHLLDGPAGAGPAGRWTVETCGFGEGEIVALERLWRSEAS
jgi:hypothetical protein